MWAGRRRLRGAGIPGSPAARIRWSGRSSGRPLGATGYRGPAGAQAGTASDGAGAGDHERDRVVHAHGLEGVPGCARANTRKTSSQNP